MIKRPEIENYVTDSWSSVGGMGLYNGLVQYSDAQDKCIDEFEKQLKMITEGKVKSARRFKIYIKYITYAASLVMTVVTAILIVLIILNFCV